MNAKRIVFSLFTAALLMSASSLDKATYELGKRLFNDERYNEAAEEFKKIISRYQDSSYFEISLYYTGLSYQFAHQPQRAMTYFKELYKQAPSDSQKELALYGVSKSYFDQSKYANAINVMKQFLQYYPGSKKTDAVLFMMGQSYDKKGYPDQSRIWYNILLREHPLSPYARYARPAQPEAQNTVVKTLPLETSEVNQTINHQQDWADLDEVQEEVLPQKDIQPQQTRIIQPLQEEQEPVTQPEKINKKPQKIVIQPQAVEEEVFPVRGKVEGLKLTPVKKIDIPVSQYDDTREIPETGQTTVLNQAQVQTQILVRTNFQNIIQTNYQSLTNMTVLTQKVKVLDTEQLKIDNKRSQMELHQEEIDRLRRLLEIKARLLELKEEAIKQKTILLQKTNAVVVPE